MDIPEEETTDNFRIPKLSDDQKLITSLVSSVQFIPLETKEGSIIKNIDELKLGENRIYILDKEQESVFIFDKAGKYINKINKKGKGPDEYYYIVDFGIYENDGVIEVYDHKKLLQYDLEGNFLNSKKVSFFARYFVRTEGGYVFFADNFCNDGFCDNLIFCDNELNVLSTGLSIPNNLKDIMHSEGRRLLKVNEGEIRLVGYDDCIYMLSDSSVTQKERVLFEEFVTPKSFYEQEFASLNSFVKKFLINPNAGFIKNYNENDHYIYFQIYKNRGNYNYIYNKLNAFKISYPEIKSKFLYNEVLDICESKFYTYLSAVKFVEAKNIFSSLNSFDKNILELNKTEISQINDTDNPIIIAYEIN